MAEEQFAPQAVNFAALDAELCNNLGSAYSGLMLSDSMIRVFLKEAVPRNEIEAILQAHDPAVLTPEQEAEAAKQTALTSGRESFSNALDLSNFNAESEAVQALAARLDWLEREIRDLRGL